MKDKTDALNDTKEHLLSVGMQLVIDNGLRGLTVRGLSRAAEVNPGGFVYHFGTRDAFLAELIEKWYEPLFNSLKLQVDTSESAIQKLRSVITQLIDFVDLHGHFITHLVLDAFYGEKQARVFFDTIADRHPKLILPILAQAQKDGDIVQTHSIYEIGTFFIGSVSSPLLVAHAFNGQQNKDCPVSSPFLTLALDRNTALQRLDWALKGLHPKNNEV